MIDKNRLEKWQLSLPMEFLNFDVIKPTDNTYIKPLNGTPRNELSQLQRLLSLDDTKEKIENWGEISHTHKFDA